MRFLLFDAWAAVGNTATTRPTFLGNLSCNARAAASTPSTAPAALTGEAEWAHEYYDPDAGDEGGTELVALGRKHDVADSI